MSTDADRIRELEEKLAATEAIADRLAASVVLLDQDAHPTYSNSTGWRGGIGGQTITASCAILYPPPGYDWTQLGLPTTVAREWIRERDIDLHAIMDELKREWAELLR